MMVKEEGIKGRIMTFDFKLPHKGASEVRIEGDLNMDTFAPLGITAYQQRAKGT